MSTHKPFVICIEGIIAAGKTSLINECLIPQWTQQGLRVRVIQEPVDKWKDILPLFYEDPKRWAYHFQSKAFLDRVAESNYVYSTYKDDTDIFICDRSIFSDPGFMNVNYILENVTDMEMRHYTEWWNMWKMVMPFSPDLFIYLSISVDTAMVRLKERSRNGENGISASYQQLLKDFHDEKYGGCHFTHDDKSIGVLKIDAHINFKNDQEVKKKIVNDIYAKLTH